MADRRFRSEADIDRFWRALHLLRMKRARQIRNLRKPQVSIDRQLTDKCRGRDDVPKALVGWLFESSRATHALVKFSKDGKSWGHHGSGQGEFDVTHGLAMDSAGRLFVADRANNRIQIFDQDGKFLTSSHLSSTSW
jgi:hypothetical protein